MAGQNLNRWCGTGNLTRDPEIKDITTRSEKKTKVANMRIAVNGRVKSGDEWVDRAHYFDLTVYGAQADAIGRYLSKGSAIAIDGHLEYQEWEKDGEKKDRVIIIGDSVQFTDGRKDSDGDREPAAAAAGSVEEDIPF